jgi:hypothetical protein
MLQPRTAMKALTKGISEQRSYFPIIADSLTVKVQRTLDFWDAFTAVSDTSLIDTALQTSQKTVVFEL